MTLPTWLFPAVMIALSLASSLVWALAGDWRRALYWVAAAVLTFSVTY